MKQIHLSERKPRNQNTKTKSSGLSTVFHNSLPQQSPSQKRPNHRETRKGTNRRKKHCLLQKVRASTQMRHLRRLRDQQMKTQPVITQRHLQRGSVSSRRRRRLPAPEHYGELARRGSGGLLVVGIALVVIMHCILLAM